MDLPIRSLKLRTKNEKYSQHPLNTTDDPFIWRMCGVSYWKNKKQTTPNNRGRRRISSICFVNS
jgi:hypothetical protein